MIDSKFKRIVLITQDYFPDIGGITTYCYGIAKNFEQMGFDVLILTKSFDGYKFNNQIQKDEYGLKVLRLEHSKWKNQRNTLVYNAIKPLINDKTLFFAANWKMSVACFFHSIFRKINYITVVHGLDAIEGRKINKFLQYKAFKNGKIIISVSRFTKNLLESQFPNKSLNIAVINGGVDLKKYKKIEDYSKVETKYSLDPGFRIVSIARLVKRKGFDNMIKAIALLNDKDMHYYIGGSGNYELDLRKLAIELKLQNNVHFLGFVSDDEIAEFYSACDVYAMPSRQLKNDVEGFGLTYIEAAACGITSIGGKNSGAEDAILQNETGILVDAESVEEIAEAIKNLKSNSIFMKELAEKAHKRAIESFSWEVKVKEIIDAVSKQ